MIVAPAFVRLALAGAMTGPSETLSGAWTVKAEFGSSLNYALLCVLRQDAQTLSGPCAAPQGRSRPTSGRIDGSKMSFTYLTDYNGSGVHLNYAG